MIQKVIKRDGRVVEFDKKKIFNAVFKAAASVGKRDEALIERITEEVVKNLEERFGDKIPKVEEIQDIVEETLVKNNLYEIAKAFILYRQKRAEARKICSTLGIVDDLKLPTNTLLILAARYLQRDENGRIIETTSQLFRRVARTIAAVEKNYGKSEEEISKLEEEFYRMMVNFEFLPNSPTLMNAGTNRKMTLSACFVLPVEDSLEKIFETLKISAIIQQAGGGCGYSFSRIRPAGDVVRSTGRIASGPISFMKIFDAATEQIKQGGMRRGANMGILRVDHPDILDFIVCKEREGVLRNFNISVAVTDKFIEAVKRDEEFELINPRTKECVKRIKARAIWNLMVTMAWKNGEPGVIFIDAINRRNPTPHIGEIEATNPCGEQPLLPYESCNLGSINLSKMLRQREDGSYEIDWEKLRKTVRLAVRFLDNVIDANYYPIPEIERMTKGNRKIGLGVMGFADMLIMLRIPYNSEEALKVAEEVMKFIGEEARKMSVELGEEKGDFPNFKGSKWDKLGYKHMRNATLTTIAPTGTISEIAGCSQGIEPLFAVAYVRKVSESLGYDLIVINPHFERIAIQMGFYDAVLRKVSASTSIQHISEIPAEVRKIFVTAHDLKPEDHIKMQAAFQKYVDNSISKTINLPPHATPTDVEKAFLLAYELGCLGVTVYRFGSRREEVLTPAANVCEICN